MLDKFLKDKLQSVDCTHLRGPLYRLQTATVGKTLCFQRETLVNVLPDNSMKLDWICLIGEHGQSSRCSGGVRSGRNSGRPNRPTCRVGPAGVEQEAAETQIQATPLIHVAGSLRPLASTIT